MEFKSLTNIESSFRRIRLMLAVFTGCCALVTGYALWSSYRFAERQREKIYVLDGGKSLMMALSQDLSQNRPAEAREHVRRFHELFFSLSPQKDAIGHNINRALQLADKSAYHYYVDFAEKGYYNRLISGNINQVVHVDSVVCDFAVYPYKATTYARQMIIRESNSTARMRYRHYGRTLEVLIKKAIEFPEGNEKRNLIALICNHMKKDYLAWNKDTVDDKKIAEDLYELSNGELQMTDDIVRLMAERLNQNYRPKTNYTNNRQNNKRRY